MLDTAACNYDVVSAQDSTVTTTAMSIVDGQLKHAERQTQKSLLKSVKSLVNHRVDSESSAPQHRRFIEDLR
jgi:hypothetical protein